MNLLLPSQSPNPHLAITSLCTHLLCNIATKACAVRGGPADLQHSHAEEQRQRPQQVCLRSSASGLPLLGTQLVNFKMVLETTSRIAC